MAAQAHFSFVSTRYVWCSSDGLASDLPRCFSGSSANECVKCRDVTGVEPPGDADGLRHPSGHQLDDYPYPTIAWAKYVLE